MCRLLGYITYGTDITLADAIGQECVDEFRDISRAHNDGWGGFVLSNSKRTAHVDDGGALSPETYESLYRSTEPAFLDDNFASFVKTGAYNAIFHLRLASSHLPLIAENQQPFRANGIAFAHNGDISDENRINLVHNTHLTVSEEDVAVTGGKSDSAIYFAYILHYVNLGHSLYEAVSCAIEDLRRTYPDSSYNCLIQTHDQLICVNATGHDRLADRVARVYEQHGLGDKSHDYRVIRYKELHDADSDNTCGVVVASSGFKQSEENGWVALPNNHVLVASANGHHDVYPLSQ